MNREKGAGAANREVKEGGRIAVVCSMHVEYEAGVLVAQEGLDENRVPGRQAEVM